MTDALTTLFSSTTTSALGVAALIVFAGVNILKNMGPDSPLSEHVLQFAGLVIIVPALIVIALVTDVPPDAVIGVFGVIVGYFFGAGSGGRVSKHSEGQ
ncbi:MAG: hypothetical protein AAGF57_04630 [Pseudomonadota bacterium]